LKQLVEFALDGANVGPVPHEQRPNGVRPDPGDRAGAPPGPLDAAGDSFGELSLRKALHGHRLDFVPCGAELRPQVLVRSDRERPLTPHQVGAAARWKILKLVHEEHGVRRKAFPLVRSHHDEGRRGKAPVEREEGGGLSATAITDELHGEPGPRQPICVRIQSRDDGK